MIGDVMEIVEVNGKQRLVVHPVAAIGTDIIGLGLATALFFSTESTELKVLSGFGALWMLTALGIEVGKLVDEAQK